ncbi:MAG: nuclear transport factor 2 family protein [Janthinobacterium lividum]
MPTSPLDIEALLRRVACLEAQNAVRDVIARYMALCDVPCSAEIPGTLADLFTPDAVWEGVGALYAKKFGQTVGVAAIIDMLQRYLPPTRHFATNVHLLGMASIHVSADAQRATGRWIMQQSSIYVDHRAENIVARLHIDFVASADAGWRICHFRTERMLDEPRVTGAHAGQ